MKHGVSVVYLEHDARDDHAELQQQVVCCRVIVSQVLKLQVVVQAVQARRHKVVQQC